VSKFSKVKFSYQLVVGAPIESDPIGMLTNSYAPEN